MNLWIFHWRPDLLDDAKGEIRQATQQTVRYVCSICGQDYDTPGEARKCYVKCSKRRED